ncbi:hypothetical protein BT69DRAFT_1038372 [Atractiella rhizophila]|nr:hypothetical protein BT69DRAFT_1038372 [Atractiella rhizophila]
MQTSPGRLSLNPMDVASLISYPSSNNTSSQQLQQQQQQSKLQSPTTTYHFGSVGPATGGRTFPSTSPTVTTDTNQAGTTPDVQGFHLPSPYQLQQGFRKASPTIQRVEHHHQHTQSQQRVQHQTQAPQQAQQSEYYAVNHLPPPPLPPTLPSIQGERKHSHSHSHSHSHQSSRHPHSHALSHSQSHGHHAHQLTHSSHSHHLTTSQGWPATADEAYATRPAPSTSIPITSTTPSNSNVSVGYDYGKNLSASQVEREKKREAAGIKMTHTLGPVNNPQKKKRKVPPSSSQADITPLSMEHPLPLSVKERLGDELEGTVAPGDDTPAQKKFLENQSKDYFHPRLISIDNSRVKAFMAQYDVTEEVLVNGGASATVEFLGKILYDKDVEPAKLLPKELLKDKIGARVVVQIPVSLLMGEKFLIANDDSDTGIFSNIHLPQSPSSQPPRKGKPAQPLETDLAFNTNPNGEEASLTELYDHVRRRKIWGSDCYTDDSDVLCMAMHSGKLRMLKMWGEKREFEVEGSEGVLEVNLRVAPKLARYEGCSRGGMRSRSWGASHDGLSLIVEKIDHRKYDWGGRTHEKRIRKKRRLEEKPPNAPTRKVYTADSYLPSASISLPFYTPPQNLPSDLPAFSDSLYFTSMFESLAFRYDKQVFEGMLTRHTKSEIEKEKEMMDVDEKGGVEKEKGVSLEDWDLVFQNRDTQYRITLNKSEGEIPTEQIANSLRLHSSPLSSLPPPTKVSAVANPIPSTTAAEETTRSFPIEAVKCTDDGTVTIEVEEGKQVVEIRGVKSVGWKEKIH